MSAEESKQLTFGNALEKYSFTGLSQSSSRKTELNTVKTIEKPNNIKPRKSQSKYAPPSKYSHLKPLVPLLFPGLRCVFIGFNPGIMTAVKGHCYAHPTNLFWKMLYESGCVDRKVTCYDDVDMPGQYKIGFTDLVSRPTIGIGELSLSELYESVPALENRIAQASPKMICIIGKGIWDNIYKYKHKKAQKRDEFEFGLQKNQVFGNVEYVYVMPSTSGLVAGVAKSVKERLWHELAEFMSSTFPLEGKGNGELT